MTLSEEIRDVARRSGRIVFLTGAGVSAESGIPTFRGKDGFWTYGSPHQTPEEMATWAYFQREPRTVWAWYLYRRARCGAAQPNAAHLAIFELEQAIGDRFALITQNVDGLHERAGSSFERTFEIHGNLHFMRCSAACDQDLKQRLPAALDEAGDAPSLDEGQAGLLHCSHCGEWLRPHVLWFDEYYSEAHFRADSAMQAAWEAELLVVIGTTGATSLPAAAGQNAARRGIPVVDINPETGYFSQIAASSPGGLVITRPAGQGVPALVRGLLADWGRGDSGK